MYLKEFRVKLNMTQKQFSEFLGIAQNAIARYENNKVTPTINVIEKYINKLNANPNYLFLGIEPHILDINEIESLKVKGEINKIENEISKLEDKLRLIKGEQQDVS